RHWGDSTGGLCSPRPSAPGRAAPPPATVSDTVDPEPLSAIATARVWRLHEKARRGQGQPDGRAKISLRAVDLKASIRTLHEPPSFGSVHAGVQGVADAANSPAVLARGREATRWAEHYSAVVWTRGHDVEGSGCAVGEARAIRAASFYAMLSGVRCVRSG